MAQFEFTHRAKIWFYLGFALINKIELIKFWHNMLKIQVLVAGLDKQKINVIKRSLKIKLV